MRHPQLPIAIWPRARVSDGRAKTKRLTVVCPLLFVTGSTRRRLRTADCLIKSHVFSGVPSIDPFPKRHFQFRQPIRLMTIGRNLAADTRLSVCPDRQMQHFAGHFGVSHRSTLRHILSGRKTPMTPPGLQLHKGHRRQISGDSEHHYNVHELGVDPLTLAIARKIGVSRR